MKKEVMYVSKVYNNIGGKKRSCEFVIIEDGSIYRGDWNVDY